MPKNPRMPELKRALWLLLLLGPSTAFASSSDYAYQADLRAAEQPLQRVDLPLEVILALTRADLGDLAVFNADGVQLVHGITRAPASAREMSRSLPFHEFSRFQRLDSKTVRTLEQNQQAGSLTELEITRTVPLESQRRDFLVELAAGEIAPAYQRIELQWTQQPADQILELRVEAGNALDELHVIQPRKSLSNRESSDRSWRSIDNIPPGYRYLRLTPVNDSIHFELQEVVEHYREDSAAPVLLHRLDTYAVRDGEREFFSFTYPSRVPAEALRIIPAAPHSMITGQLYASWGKSDERRLIESEFRQHNITAKDVRASEPIRLRRRDYRRLSLTSDTALSAAPTIELLYPQYQLLFLGDGNRPYRLAWGNYQGEGPSSALESILQGGLRQAQLDAVAVTLGAIEEAGGRARLAPAATLPWKKWLLWTLLLLAVIVTARMARKLYREMNAAPST
jgi:hypothetical protein